MVRHQLYKRSRGRWHWVLPLVGLILAAAAAPPNGLDDPGTAEGWVWQEVKAGRVADLNVQCKTEPSLETRTPDNMRWKDRCRRIDAETLRALLTRPKLADEAPHGVSIRGAYIKGELDLAHAHVTAALVSIADSWLDGDLSLSSSTVDGMLDLNGIRVDGRINADYASIKSRLTLNAAVLTGGITGDSMHVAGDLMMKGAELGANVYLPDAHVDGRMDLDNAKIADGKAFSAERLHVGAGGLFMRQMKFGGPVDVTSVRVDGQMSLVGASTAKDQTFNAERLHVGAGGLFMRQMTFLGPVNLRDAHVDGQMSLDGGAIAKDQMFDAERLHVGAGGLFMRQMKFDGPVDLGEAKVDGTMSLVSATVAKDQRFNAENLHVGGDLVVRNATFGGAVDFLGLGVNGDLDLRQSRLRQVDLGNATIRDDLRFGGRFDDGSDAWTHWDACDAGAICLNLRNAKIGNLQDHREAWPPRLTLEGFTYTHLGGIGGEGRQDMRSRSTDWWRDWLQRDPTYSAQPYAQLASVLAAGGNSDAAADVRFFGRERERSQVLRGCEWAVAHGLAESPETAQPCGTDQ